MYQVFLDYVHVLSRFPELQEQEADTAATELDELARSIPKLIELLPEVLRNRDDPRHNVALADMTSALMTCLDRVKPLALVSSVPSQYLISCSRLASVADTNQAGDGR